ncbi:MAG: hypothetical protein QGF56_06120 [Verrucomicrobiota bacterium]|nr:hypothetical protein [Verrucomicrobiota bacterium]MDP6753247.1 hypothetical protein [Verrucomicrobiota bacterium]
MGTGSPSKAVSRSAWPTADGERTRLAYGFWRLAKNEEPATGNKRPAGRVRLLSAE